MQSIGRTTLLFLALAHILLFMSGLFAFRFLVPGVALPSPLDPAQVAQQFYLAHGNAVRFAAFLQFASALPLAFWTASIGRRGHEAERSPTGERVGLFGGWGTSLLLLLAGLCSWVATDPEVAASLGTIRALQDFTFALGGPGFALLFGLLAAGVVMAERPWLPRWLVWLGGLCALCGLLASLTLVTMNAALFIPLTRFPGFLWLLGTSLAAGRPAPQPARSTRK